jgi:membrane protease subunit (stomatin/prohibitin family)
VVSNEEIKRMLEAKRRGIDIKKENKKSEIKLCSNCQTKNPNDAKFCVECGETLNHIDRNVPKKIINRESTTNTDNNINNKKPVNETEPVQKTNKTESDVTFKPKPKTPTLVPEHNIITKPTLKKSCPSCNTKNLKNAKYCVVCGEKFEVNDANLTKSSPNSKDIPSTDIKVPKSILELKKESANEEVFDKKIVDTNASKTNNMQSENSTDNIDPVEKIKKAKELLDIGAITSEEFENIKKKYLEQI